MPKYILEEHPSDDGTDIDEFDTEIPNNTCEKYEKGQCLVNHAVQV